ncbi:mitochondrial RNA binding protein 1 [Trypanosoma conorhini]|uniref:Mitochondrial RNA binding protein 1 n=1 Tax=Trypanosoma conorhini TaxID=83891 RepID=A0A3R7KRD6_9TRYP|nr:mitochondrial RNA binding protein 1 [Trypanosoma conorhini]RNF08214.1 mitochondrial RNA binding protein 1 [Trypanosoma conorhini]
MLRFVSGRASLAHAAVACRYVAAAGFQGLPKFEIHDVRDDPALGTMTRVAVDGKLLLISQYPQLGPRKVDPNDLSPQFDADRRISVRLRHIDLAALVCVCRSRVPKHEMTNRSYSLVFEKSVDGYHLYGKIHRVASQKMEDWSVSFDKHFAVTLEHFLESALTESFGFRQHYAARPPEGGARDANGAVAGAGGGQQRRRNADATQRR